MEDYYEILGVPPDASDEEIKKAFWRLAKKYHPDSPGGDPEKFKKINEAYQVLSDKKKRAMYDQQRKYGFSSVGSFGGFDFGDVFKDFGFIDLDKIFEDFFETKTVKRKEKGNNINVDLELSLKEAAFGTEKTIYIEKFIVCDRCRGSGVEPGSGFKVCPTCNGSGQVKETRSFFIGSFSQIKICSLCEGEGKIPEKFCLKCYGRGRVKSNVPINLKIPPGTDEDDLIRFKGEGDAGLKGGPAGDLFLRIKIKRDPIFEKDGINLKTKLKVNVLKIWFGGEIEIPTLEGKIIKYKLKPETKVDEPIVIKNYGFVKGNKRGDLLVFLVPDFPKLPPNIKKLLEDFLNKMES
jgi:molecular chaperone DnaJ